MVEEPDGERLKEWVEEKLEEGVDRERLKESLRETGHDPSIVDEASHPFSEESEVESDPFEETSAETNEDDEETEEIEEPEQETEEEVQEVEEQDFEPESGTEDISKDSNVAESDEESSESSSRFSGMPSFDVPEKEPLKKVGVVVLILALSVSVFTVLGQEGVIDGANTAAAASNDCPSVSIKIVSVSSSTGSTTATVRVSGGEADVVLEIFDGGGKVGETTATVQGEEQITVSGIGGQARLHPEGCLKNVYETTY